MIGKQNGQDFFGKTADGLTPAEQYHIMKSLYNESYIFGNKYIIESLLSHDYCTNCGYKFLFVFY